MMALSLNIDPDEPIEEEVIEEAPAKEEVPKEKPAEKKEDL
jgi:hypothetical protein